MGETAAAPIGDMQAVVEALDGARTPKIVTHGDCAFACVPTPGSGWKFDDITRTIEAAKAAPDRQRGTSKHLSLDSLLDHIKFTGTDDNAFAIFADPTVPQVVAIYNYTNGWGDLRAVWTCELSDEFKAWRAVDRKMLPQVTFAEHLLENMGDIGSVDGTDAAGMLEAAKDLEIIRDVAFAQRIDLTSGAARFKYQEDDKTTGSLILPREFSLVLPVFVDSASMQGIRCQLRYRVKEGALTLGIVMLPRPERVIRDALEVALDRITEAMGVKPFVGTAEALR